MKITEAQLTPWFPDTTPPTREGWYLVSNADGEEFWQSTAAFAPKFDIPDTVWRYWTGSKWMWHGPESFTFRSQMATAPKAWHDANVGGCLWRGLAETFVFHPMSMLPR